MNIINYIKKKIFFNDIFFSLLIINFGNFLNYLSNIIYARNLSLDDFGKLNSFFSVIFFLTIPLLITQQLTLRYLKYNNSSSKSFFTNFFVFYNISLIIFMFFFYEWIFKSLDIKYFKFYFIVTFFTCVFQILHSVIIGYVLFYKSQKIFSILSSVWFLLNFTFLIFFIISYYINVEIITLIRLVCLVVTTYLSYFILKSNHFNISIRLSSKKDNSLKFIFNNLIPIFITQLIVLSAVNFDILICRSFCSSENSGYFAYGSIFSKIVFFFFAAISMIVLNESLRRPNNANKFLLNIFVFIIPLLILYNLVFYFFSSEIIKILFNVVDENIISISLRLNLGMSLLTITSFIFQYFLSQKEIISFSKQLFVLITTFFVTYLFNNGNPILISDFFLYSNIFILIFTLYDYFKIKKISTKLF